MHNDKIYRWLLLVKCDGLEIKVAHSKISTEIPSFNFHIFILPRTIIKLIIMMIILQCPHYKCSHRVTYTHDEYNNNTKRWRNWSTKSKTQRNYKVLQYLFKPRGQILCPISFYFKFSATDHHGNSQF